MIKKIINKDNRNDEILHRNKKRKFLPDEESFVEAKKRKVLPLISNESEENDSDMNLDYSNSFDDAQRIKTKANIKAIPLMKKIVLKMIPT